MSAFDNLIAEVRACKICAADLPFGPRPVLQCDPRARILLAGQAPGRKVHASGIPFDDPSGERLRAWMGVDRETFYDAARVAILPMGFCYPGSGRSGDLPPRPECAAQWRAALLQRLPEISLLLVMGRYAHDYHFDGPRLALTERVRRWREYWPAMLPLPHPSPRNNGWLKQNPWFERDLLPEMRARIATLLQQDYP